MSRALAIEGSRQFLSLGKLVDEQVGLDDLQLVTRVTGEPSDDLVDPSC